MSRGTIKLPEEEYERHNEQRKEMGLSWAEYIEGQSPDLEDVIRRVVREEMDEVRHIIRDELDEDSLR